MNQSKSERRNNSTIWIQLIIAVVITGFNIFMILCHESWRDEAQSWLIARDSNPLDIFNLTSVEGHPFLYFYILMPFAKLGLPYVTANFISLVVMVIAMYVFIRYVDLHIVIKLLALCSPMFIYYYPVFARNYSLCGLFMILSMAMYHKKNERPIRFGIVLALLAQTHIIILGFVMVLSAVWLIENILISINEKNIANQKLVYAGIGIVVCSGILLLLEFRNVFSAMALDKKDSSSGESGNMSTILMLIIVTAILLGIVRIFIKNKNTYGAILILLVSHVWELIVLLIYQGHTWQIITWIYVLVFAFVMLNDKETAGKKKSKIITGVVLTVITIPAIISGYKIKPIIKDIKGNYSDSKSVAEYIDKNVEDDAVVIFNDEDYCLAPIPYLKKNNFYNIFTEKKASYIDRRNNLRHTLTADEYKKAKENVLSKNKNVYFLYSVKSNMIDDIEKDLSSYNEVYKYNSDKIIAEKFILYKLK